MNPLDPAADRAARAAEPAADLAAFLASPPGRYLLAWEQQQFDAAVADVFGYHALQLGLPEIDALRENRMPLRVCASDRRASGAAPGRGPRVAVMNDFAELPFMSQTIDLVVLPHILEFAAEPHQVLREVDRVLVPEGHLIVSGFNPASLWGLREGLGRLGAAPFLPRGAQMISLSRIKDWLKLLSLEPSRGRFGCYLPWARSQAWLARWHFLESVGDRWWPVLGSVYMLTAVKRVRAMRLVGRLWKRREERRPTLAALPTAGRAMFVPGDGGCIEVLAPPEAANDPRPGAAVARSAAE